MNLKQLFPLRGQLCALALAGIAACGLAASPCEAGLVVLGSPPPSVMEGDLESNTDAYIFFESTQTLAAPLGVDIASPGLYNFFNPNDPGSVAAGTPVNSYFLHRDSVEEQLSSVTVFGTFPHPVLGIIIEDANLDASDPILGSPTTLYPTGLPFRGLEVPALALADVVFWSGNMVFLSISSTTAEVLDHVRIVTAIPEPSTMTLAILAPALCAAAWRHRRRTETLVR